MSCSPCGKNARSTGVRMRAEAGLFSPGKGEFCGAPGPRNAHGENFSLPAMTGQNRSPESVVNPGVRRWHAACSPSGIQEVPYESSSGV